MRFLKILVTVCIALYLTAFVALTVMQRSFIFPASDGSEMEAINWQAIKGQDRFFIETEDGETLSAWYQPPQAGKPVFMFFHGNGGRLDLMKWRWQRIMKEGYGIFTLSYRGYPGSTGSPSEEGLINDARAGWKWLSAKHQPDDIIIHGLSLGSGVATALATEVDAKALILEASFSAVVDVAAERFPIFPTRWVIRDTFLSRERIAEINMPLLVVHGTEDSVIPFHLGQRLFERAVEPKQFIAMEGSDHSTLVRDGVYPLIWGYLAGLES